MSRLNSLETVEVPKAVIPIEIVEEAYLIHRLYRGLELSDLGIICDWQEEINASGLGIRIDDFPGTKVNGLIHPFQFAMNTSGCGFHLKLIGSLGKLSLDTRSLPGIFSRFSLEQLPEGKQP